MGYYSETDSVVSLDVSDVDEGWWGSEEEENYNDDLIEEVYPRVEPVVISSSLPRVSKMISLGPAKKIFEKKEVPDPEWRGWSAKVEEEKPAAIEEVEEKPAVIEPAVIEPVERSNIYIQKSLLKEMVPVILNAAWKAGISNTRIIPY